MSESAGRAALISTASLRALQSADKRSFGQPMMYATRAQMEAYYAFNQALPALANVVDAAREVSYVFDCCCDDAYTQRGLHGPNCLYEEGHELRESLAAFEVVEASS